MSFDSKVVIVTGSSSGIGAAIALKFTAEKAKVVIVGRNEKKLKDITAKCEQLGSKPLVIVADVSKDHEAKRIIDDTVKKFGKIDVLINNAGIGGGTSILHDKAMDVFDRIIATNLRASVYLTHLAAKHLIETKGNIVNISSVASKSVISDEGFGYATSKAGLDHFSRCAALELASKGVRVNVINPGPVKSDIYENAGSTPEREAAIWDFMKKATPLHRITEPGEIADLALFLASDKAVGITGSTFVSDNGSLLGGYNILKKNY